MKTIRTRKNRNEGSVLLVTMCVLTVGLIALSAYLMLVQDENNAVSRSQSWNTIISVSEAGMEEGLAAVNQGFPSPYDNAWTNHVPNWTSTDGVHYTLSRTVYGSNSYTVSIDISNGKPLISSVGVVPYTPMPWSFSANRSPMFAAAGMPILAQGAITGGTTTGTTGGTTTASTSLGRKITVQTVMQALFTAAIVAKSNIDMHGNNTIVDSFDSSSAQFSLNGLYSSTKRLANGNVGSDSSISNSVNIGQGNIYGKVMTGPGTVQNEVKIGNNGAVGDVAWNQSHKGIETGYWQGDFNVAIPDVPTPAAGGSFPAASNGAITLSGGSYTGTDPNTPLIITNGVNTVWIQGSYNGNITIATNASLILYVGTQAGSGDTLKWSGQSQVNYPGYAADLQVYGLPSLNTIDLTGNATFISTIYAPEADMKGGGGGNNNLDTSGAMIVRSVTLNGKWNFHYDQSLTNNGPIRGWVPNSWSEVKYTSN